MCYLEFGKMFRFLLSCYKYVVAGSISKLGDTYSIHLRLINTKGADTGVKKRKSEKCRYSEDELFFTARTVAALIMGKKKPDREIDRDERFIAHNNGMVMDTKTGLMWAANDNGKDINWDDAKAFCASYRGGGFMDWRMPTPAELAEIYDRSKIGLHVTMLIGLTNCYVWTSARRGSDAAYFDFDFSGLYWTYDTISSDFRTLPVRRDK